MNLKPTQHSTKAQPRWAALLVASLLYLPARLFSAEAIPGQVDLAKIPQLQPHYQHEFAFDTAADPAAWSSQSPGLHAAFASTDQLYLRCEVPAALPRDVAATTWEATGWKGERLNAQLLVWSAEQQEQIRIALHDLKGAPEPDLNPKRSQNRNANRVIPCQQLKAHLVRYVLSNLPYRAKGFTCDITNNAAYLMPDRLEPFSRFDLPARSVRPIWIAIDIPRTAKPGTYEGTIDVQSSFKTVSLRVLSLRVRIHVQDQTLPPPAAWSFRLDLWQNPWVVSSFFQVEPWSDAHKALLKQHLKLYADAGGKYITTYTVHSPWSDNSYVLEGTMIEWIKTTNGSWKFDYSLFDQYVQLAIEAGVTGAITIYTPIPWGHRFRYLDQQSGNFVYVEWSPKSPEFKTFWNSFLTDLRGHLNKKGWFEKTYLGINENPMDLTLAAIKVIKEHSKDWRITYAGDWHAELSPLLDDYSTIITREPSRQDLLDRNRQRKTTTFYLCCNPPQPNNFVFSPPAESRFIGWYCAAYGYNGFLRWAYDAWPADPMRDARHTLWPAGDCFLVYPGASSSIRFEKLREGIVDFEKIRILRAKASRSSNASTRSMLQDLEKHLLRLAAEPDYSKRDYDLPKMIDTLEQGKTLIQQLSD